MNIERTALDGVCIITPQIFTDERGAFFESYNTLQLREQGIDVTFVQDNESYSVKNVLRGLHFQNEPHAQAKLVRCVVGRVLDVAVDIRPGSSTYLRHVSVELSGENKKQLFIPKGFAHGFLVLSDEAIVCYKIDAHWNKASESGLLWNDPKLGIDWGIDARDVIIAKKDLLYTPL